VAGFDSRPEKGPTSASIQLVSGVISPVPEQTEGEAHTSPTPTVEVNNNNTTLPPIQLGLYVKVQN
jgi:hypothetical protein